MPPDSIRDSIDTCTIVIELDEINSKIDKLTYKLDSLSQINLEKPKYFCKI